MLAESIVWLFWYLQWMVKELNMVALIYPVDVV